MMDDNIHPTVNPATEKQKKMFFALCNQLNIEADSAKDRAKKKFGVEHFSELQSDQLKELIDALLQKINLSNKKLLTDCISYFNVAEARKINPDIKTWEDYAPYLADYILQWFTVKSK